jgi:hypothetical protein
MKQLLQNAADLDYDLDLETIPDEELLEIDGLGAYDEDDEIDGLGYTGHGRARRGRKSRRSRGRRRGRKARAARRSRKGRRKARRSRKVRAHRRRRSRRSRRARAHRKGSRRRSRRVRRHRAAKVAKKSRRRRRKSASKKAAEAAAMEGLGKMKRRRRRRKSKASAPRRRHRRARRSRRSRSVAGIGVMGRALGKLANTVALQGLGKAGKRRRKKSRRKSRKGSRRARAHRRRKHRKSARKAHRRARVHHRRRKGSRRRSRRMSGLGSLFRGLGSIGNMGAGLADAEVASSMYGVGAFQYLISMPGLEALGGVSLASIVSGIVSKGLFGKLLNLGPAMADAGLKGVATRVGSAAVSAAAMWELGRLLGSGNLAKFGAFYALGRAVENELVNPYIMTKIPGLAGFGMYGLGQARIPDAQELRDLGYLAQARIPDQDELRDIGQRIVTEEELLGDVGADEGDAGADGDSNVF